MFLFPEPPPIDYVLREVSPSFLSDDVLLHDKQGPTHKCIAKQLRPIKRQISDPVAPVSYLDPSSFDSAALKQRSWYAGSRDAFLIYELSSQIKEQTFIPRKRGDEISIFPRSWQFEYDYIRKRRLENVPKDKFGDVFQCQEEKERNETTRTDVEPCYILRPPFWWKDKTNEEIKLPIGSIDDYAFRRLEYVEDDKRKNERSMTANRPFDRGNDKIQTPGIAQKTKGAANTMEGPKRISKRECSCKCCPAKKGSTQREERWQPLYEISRFPGTDAERNETMRTLTKPYLHELHTWYSQNLPTKLLLPVRWTGKRPITECRFSHL